VWGGRHYSRLYFVGVVKMQWTVHSNDDQVAFEMGDSPRVIKITSLKLSISECWSINRCRKLVATS